MTTASSGNGSSVRSTDRSASSRRPSDYIWRALLDSSHIPARKRSFAWCGVVLLLLGASIAAAQTTVGFGLNQPFAVTVDSTGNVFIADTGNNRLVEVPVGCSSSSCQTTMTSICCSPQKFGVAVDANDDVFIADSGNMGLNTGACAYGGLFEVPSGGGSPTCVTGYAFPNGGQEQSLVVGVAVDTEGDVFASYNYHFYSPYPYVTEFRTVGPCYGGPNPIGTGLSNPYGVAVDSTCNVYIVDAGLNQIVEVSASGVQTTIGTGLSSPSGVAVDSDGDVFIADTGNNQVVGIPVGGAQTTVYSGLNGPSSVAIGPGGNIYIADTGNNRVLVISNPFLGPPGPVTFAGGLTSVPGNINVCTAVTAPAPCNATLTLTYNINAAVTFASAPSVLTEGAPNLDFTLSSTTCTGSQAAGSTCTVIVSFAPFAPGLRMGAVQLLNSSYSPLATTLIQGIGEGPAIAIGPGNQTTLPAPANGYGNPTGIAVDGTGDVFVADNNNNQVEEIAANSGAVSVVVTGLSDPGGVAVDGAGDLYVADSGNNRVLEVPYLGNGTYSTAPIVIATTTPNTAGFVNRGPNGVALDGAGDLFIADSSNNQVLEILAGTNTPLTVASGFSWPYSCALDSAGNLFVADTQNQQVLEFLYSGTPGMYSMTPVTVANSSNNGVSWVFSVAVDAADDVFLTDTFNSQVLEFPYQGNQTWGAGVTVGTGMSYPSGVAVDRTGNVFIGDSANNRVEEVLLTPFPAQTLTFATTTIGNTSTDSPKLVTVQNIGNQSLTAISPGLNIGPDFVLGQGSGACTSAFSLAPGATCNLSISFVPQNAGSLREAAAFTDNYLNSIPSATQEIKLQGTGLMAQNITFTVPAPPTAKAGDSFTVVATGGGSANPVIFSVGTGSVCTLTSPATYSMNSNTGYCYVIANQAGSNTYAVAPQVTETVTAVTTVTKVQPTVTFTGAPSSAAYLSTFTVATTQNSGITPTITAAPASTCSISGNTVTMNSGAGTCTVTATWATDTYYLAATATQKVTAQKLTPVIDFTGAPISAPYLSTFTVATTQNSGITPTITAAPASTCSISGYTVTMNSGTGTCTLTAKWATNDDYLGAAETQKTTAERLTPAVTFTGAPSSAQYLSIFPVATTQNSGITPTISSTTRSVCTVENGYVYMKTGTGTCVVEASWAANNYYSAATVQQSATATKLPTTTTITGTLVKPNDPLRVYVYFTVSNGTTPPPTASVYMTTTNLVSCKALVIQGICPLLFSSKTTGPTVVTAVYGGDDNNATSTSAPYSLTVQ